MGRMIDDCALPVYCTYGSVDSSSQIKKRFSKSVVKIWELCRLPFLHVLSKNHRAFIKAEVFFGSIFVMVKNESETFAVVDRSEIMNVYMVCNRMSVKLIIAK